jgi:Tfp pilus assembly protein PilF
MDERLRYADSLLERALQLAPSHVPALCGRGKVQCQLDNMTSAEMSFRAALKVAPHDWRSLSNYGVMLVSHIGDTQNGERLLERALAHAPNPSVARMLETLKTQTLQLGELRVPTLAKDPRQVRWEERDLNYQEARVPYDR